MRIHAALMTQNELTDLRENVAAVLPFVDTVNIVDGGSVDLTIPYMRNWSREHPKIRYFIHPWTDDFPRQRNNYLARVGEIAEPGDWVLTFDPDEFLDPSGLRDLRSTLFEVDRAGYGLVTVQCRSVTLRGDERVREKEDQHWKPLLYRWNPNIAYTHDGDGPVHERLTGAAGLVARTGEGLLAEAKWFYEHRKQADVIWVRGARNYFCGGGGPNLGRRNPRWVELRQISEILGLHSWHEMQRYLLLGNIDQRLKDWMIKYRQESGWDGSSEQREWYKTYFRFYHPEEEPEEMRGETIP